MRAVRIKHKGKGRHHAVHWLVDDELTRCGLNVDALDVVEDLDIEELPAVEGCRGCLRDDKGWTKPKPTIAEPYTEPYGYALTASHGRMSRQGKLRHTGRSGHGHRLR